MANDAIIYVEYNAKVLVGVDSAGDVISVTWNNGEPHPPTGNLFAYDGNDYVSVGVAEPPPKFASIEEAEEWMESNAGKSKFAVEITQDRANQVSAVAATARIEDHL